MTSVAAAAFVPMAPLLFRHLAGAGDPLAELRAAAVDAVREACAGAGEVVVLCPVGGREAPGDWHDPTRSGAERGDPRSLAAQVGAHLLELAAITTPVQFLECVDGSVDDHRSRSDSDPAGGTVLVVLGDGAAARSQGAPGHIDDRSFAYDDALAHALGNGDSAALAALAHAAEAVDLMVTGRHTWPVVAEFLPRPSQARLAHRSDPFGLTYVVATWRA